MNGVRLSILPLIALAVPLAYGQKPAAKRPAEPIETTVCKIFDDSASHHNGLVKVRGYVNVSFEYSLLMDEHCPEKQIWFAFGDGSVPRQVQAYVNGRRSAPSASLTVTLVKDKNYAELTRYLELSAKGAACADEPAPESLPDCTTYRVTATFTGRVDSVSKELHAAHMKRSDFDRPDGKGFGHMGLFDAQIVVRNVENVVAVDEADLRNVNTKPER
jgi:hypothetical protein